MMLMRFLAWVPLEPTIDTKSAATWVLVILSGGGAVGVFTLVKAWLAVRDNVETREATAIANLEKWRVDADTRAERCLVQLQAERQWSAYWERVAAHRERVLVLAGIEVPVIPPPPSDRP